MHPLIDFFGDGVPGPADDDAAPRVRVHFVNLTPAQREAVIAFQDAIDAGEPSLDAGADRWRRVIRMTWRAYEERTRREGESAPPLYDWDEPELEDERDEQAGAEPASREERRPMKQTTPDNMTPRQIACVAAYRALAKETGAKPAPTEVAKRAKLECSQPSSAVINALRAAVDRGIELPFWATTAPRGARTKGGKKTPPAHVATAPTKRAAAGANVYEAPLVHLRSRLAELEEERGRVLKAIEAVEALA